MNYIHQGPGLQYWQWQSHWMDWILAVLMCMIEFCWVQYRKFSSF